MPYSGGVFSLTYNWTTEQASPPIEISKLQTQETDIATGLSNCILRDGTGVPTAATPWNNQKITGLGAATLADDAVKASQIQSGALVVLGSVSGADTITASLTPTLAAYATGMHVIFTPASANTGAATLNINSLGAKSIKKGNGTALAANDMLTTVPAVCVYDGTNFVLINPQTVSVTGGLFGDGLVGSPSLSFTADTDTGFYRSAGNEFFAVAGGTQAARFGFSGTAFFQVADGTSAQPGFAFFGDSNTGIYRAGADDMRLVAGGAYNAGISASGMEGRFQDGLASAPAINFFADTDTGFYRIAANRIGLALGGSNYVDFSTVAAIFAVPVYTSDGAVGAPAFTFGNDTDTGFYRIGANNIGVSCGGTKALDITASGTTITGTATATTFSGSGASLTALNATQLTSGTLPAARLPTAAINTNVSTIGALFAGRLNMDATPTVISITSNASGWTVSQPSGTGTLRVTHNLGLSSTDSLVVNATTSGTWPTFAVIGVRNVNYFDVYGFTTAFASADVDIEFTAVRIAA